MSKITLKSEAAGVELALTFVEMGNRRATEAWRKYAQARVNEMAAELENLQIELREAMAAEFCTKCGGIAENCTDCSCDACGSHVNECICEDDDFDEYDANYEREIRETEESINNSNIF